MIIYNGNYKIMSVLKKLLRESYDLQESEPEKTAYWHLQMLIASIKDEQIKEETLVNENVTNKEIKYGVYCGHRFYPNGHVGDVPVPDRRTKQEIEAFFKEEEQRRIDNDKANF